MGYPSIDGATATVAATNFAITIQPPTGEVWLIDAISIEHNDTATKSISLLYDDQRFDMEGIYLSDEDGWPIVKDVESLIYPVFIDRTPDHTHIAGHYPIQLHDYMAVVLGNVTAMTNGKVVTVNYAYRRVL
jgi:hypothetical protein